MKKALRNIFNCIVVSMILLGCAVTCLAANVAATNVTIHGHTMTYAGTQTTIQITSGSQSTDGSTGCQFDGTSKFTLSATNSKYHNYFVYKTYAQNYSMKLTLTNSSGSTIKITYTTDNINGVTNGQYADVTMQDGDSLSFTVATSETSSTQSKQNTVTGTVTINSITTVAGAKVSFVSSSNGSYSAVVGEETISMSSGAEATEDYNVNIGGSITLTAGQATEGYEFYCWMGGGKQLGTTNGSYTINEDMVIYPVYLPEGTEKPFTVDGTGYMFWHQALAASKDSGKPAVLTQNYTLPTTLEANGLCSGHLYGDYVSGTDGNLTYMIPYGSKLLIPYGSGDTGSFGATPQNYISEEDGCLMFDEDGIATRNFVYRTLTVPGGAKIACYGGLNPNGQRQNNGQPYTGVTLGGYGKIQLSGSGTQLTVYSGGALYCYGYITGSGKVEILSGGNVHELLQICDWPGGSNAANPLGSWNTTADENTLFLLSQYYIQNIETPLKVNYGATAYIEAVITGYQQTIPNSSVYIGTGGLFILESGAYLERIYDAANDRMDYHIYGGASLSSITVKTDFIFTVTLTSSKYILPLNGNIRVYVEDEAEMTLAQKIALLPGAEVIIKEGGTVNSSSEVYIVDVNDWAKSYFFTRTGFTTNKSPKFNPLPYVATLDSVSARTTALCRGEVADDDDPTLMHQKYYMNAKDCTASGKLVVNGTLNISGTICTTNKSSSANKAITGTGIINYTGTPAAGTLKAGYNKNISTISTTHGLGNLAGIGTLQPITAGTHYGLGDYWYQHIINTEGGTVAVNNTNDVAGATLSPLDSRFGTISNIVARVADGGSISFTADGYDVSVNGEPLTATNGTYTLSNITADTTLVLTEGCSHTGGTATCTKQAICELCGKAYGELDPNNHSYESEVTKPTCTTGGYTTYICSCGDTYTGDTVAATGHSAVTDAAVAATCKNTGLTEGSHCSVCNEVLVAQKVVEKLPHTEVVDAAVPPTCTSTGLTEGKHCSVCGEIIIKQEKQPALGHTEVIDEAVEATCKAPGKTQGSHCSVCNTVLDAQEEIPQLAHTEVVVAGKAATCTETGLTEGKKCSVCGEVLVAQTPTEMTPHTEVIDEAVAATCTTDGKTEGSHCSVCDQTIVAQETISATGHTPETIPGYAETCVKDGLTDGERCSVCGEVITPQTEIPATGIHTWENGLCTVCGASSAEICPHENYEKILVEVIAPTCTAQGYTVYQCDNCGGTYNSDYEENTGHTPGPEATCEDPQFCEVCKTELAPAAGHNYSAVVTAPTCTDAGYTTYTCSKCGNSYKENGDDALGHTKGASVTENEAGNTCIGTSYDTVVYCTVCSTEISRETITTSAQGHKNTEEVTPPTCTEQGYTTHTCSVCGHVSKDTPTPATGHSYSETWSVTKPATYNTPAEESSKCDNCDAAQTRTINSAAVDGAEYLTLSEALGKAGEGATVILLTDIDGEITVSQVVTIAKAGFTADISAGKGYTYTESGTTVIIGKAQLSIYATNIKAGDSLDLYFYIQKTDLSGTDYKAVINRTKAGVATEPVEIPYAEWTDYGSYKRFYYDGIAAKEMTDEVTVTICDTQGNPLSSATTETIQGYALRVLSRTTDAELRTALVDMLNYGAAAQKKLDNYNGKDLANANTESYQVYATQEDVECREEPKDDNVKLKSASVSVKSNLYYTFYFAGIDNTMSATATYTDHYGNEKTVSIPGSEFHAHTDTDGSTLWGVDVKGLAIADGRQQITCEVMDENNTMIAKGIGSVQGYVASAANQGENAAVYGMLMKFVDSAYAYFH